MRTLNLEQGSPEWHAHRATARNASDAPAVMGCSPYVSRAELIRQRATGAEREYDAATLKRFERGHEVEPALRAIAERLIDDDLFRVVGVSDDGYLSASFDGVTMDGRIILEAKQTNAEKISFIERQQIPPADHWQVVHQFAVNEKAQKCIYAVGDGTDGGTYTMEVIREQIEADIPKLRAAWQQFDADLANYKPEQLKAEVVAQPVAGFGALALRVEGRVLASNLDEFKAGADAFISRLPKPAELQTDQDFANADAAVKACTEAEDRIKAACDAALAQMADVDAIMRAANDVRETIRAARLALDRAVKAEKENRRNELVRSGADAVREHYSAINATLKGFELGVPASLTSDIGAAIKGLKSLDSIRDKISGVVAQAKIAASQEADRRRLSIAVLDEHADHRALLPDAAALVASKSPDDLRNLIAARVAEHEAKIRQQAEETAERERARIRDEERQRAAEEAARTHTPSPAYAANTEPPSARAAASPTSAGAAPMPAAKSGARLKLGDINARIAPLSISAEGLASLGIQPVAVEKAAKLYAESDFVAICNVLSARLQRAAAMQEAA